MCDLLRLETGGGNQCQRGKKLKMREDLHANCSGPSHVLLPWKLGG